MSDSAPDGSAADEELDAQTPQHVVEPDDPAPQSGQEEPGDQPAHNAAEPDAAESQGDLQSQAPTPETEDDPSQQTSGNDRNYRPKGPTVVVRYGLMRQIGEFRHNQDPSPPCGTKVVVRTERGVELGRVIACVCDQPCGASSITPERLHDFVMNNGADFPFRRGGKLLRIANQQDMIDHRHLESSAREAAAFCRGQIREMKLPMKLVSVEHLLGGGRIIFYFASEGRVDFRNLVHDLADQYHTRIEMKQVGARDEARLVADYERCGRRCCCQQFLKDLRPVAMRMAKTQKATLDPSKISGRCGRLMCCLRYEDATYDMLRKTLPKRNTWVRTAEVIGKVVDTHIITQLVRLGLQDNSTRTVAVDEIIERSLPAPPPPQQTQGGQQYRPASPSRTTSVPRRLEDELITTDADPEAETEAEAPKEPAPDKASGKEEQPRARSPRSQSRSRRSRQNRPSPAETAQAQPTAPIANTQSGADTGGADAAGTDAKTGADAAGKDSSTPKNKRTRRRGRRGRRKKRPAQSE